MRRGSLDLEETFICINLFTQVASMNLFTVLDNFFEFFFGGKNNPFCSLLKVVIYFST